MIPSGPKRPPSGLKKLQEPAGRPPRGSQEGARRPSNGAKMTPRDLAEDVRSKKPESSKMTTVSSEKLDFGRLNGQKYIKIC